MLLKSKFTLIYNLKKYYCLVLTKVEKPSAHFDDATEEREGESPLDIGPGVVVAHEGVDGRGAYRHLFAGSKYGVSKSRNYRSV